MSSAHRCTICQRVFASEKALEQHRRDKADHLFPCSCGKSFSSAIALEQHQPEHSELIHQKIRYFCEPCNRDFISSEALLSHISTSKKHSRPTPQCTVCWKMFSSSGALQQHISSRVHAEPEFLCPLCSTAFKQPSAIAHHVESCTCPRSSPVTRHQVTAAVHALDVIPPISIHKSVEGSSGVPAEAIQVSYSANELAWNYILNAYQCFLCGSTFKTLGRLNQHLGSAAHDALAFRCPKKKCRKEFKVISAFMQHIESGACGLAPFSQIEDFTKAFTDQFTRLLRV